ncbi:importin 4 [Heterostelium album PN500]|uniref:Importin 4 n=1 Tax=Heterostelium pallidum (strain ATCC 26659 / Pp 5 / PN500) TaxID=670386 RepID=D3AZM2_HETP5|nr:importin 4 [Heterostelium album PN500]EFA85401.1 importin 4 [Heterostelium album PN500]|eukprot:XP_020437510.1 importin 4 [Heterostelium album PN500]
MATNEIAEVELNLRGFLEPNTEVVQRATNNMNRILKKPSASLILIHFIQSSPYREIKHLAAVLLRKKLVVHWTKLSSKDRDTIKPMFIDLFLKETDGLLKKSIAEVMIIIARVELPLGEWKTFTPFLFGLSESQNPLDREFQMYTIETLLQNDRITIAKNATKLVNALNLGLGDQVAKVRSAALRAVGSAMIALSGETDTIRQLIQLIPRMLQVLKSSIENEMEDDVITSFEVFDDLAESQSPAVFQQLPAVVQFSIEVAANVNIDSSIRTSALEFLRTMIEFEGNSDDLDDNYLYQTAGIALRYCGESFSARYIFHPLVPVLKEFAQSNDMTKQVALPLIIQQLSYGCAEDMRDNIELIAQLILHSLGQQDKIVRQNACVAVARLSENIHPEFYRYSNQIFPLVFKSLDDPDDAFILRCCYALENFIVNLEREQIVPIIDSVMSKMGTLLQRNNIQVKEFALSAICAVALASESDFAPYFDSVLSTIRDLLITKEPNLLSLRANAFECVGSMAKAVPKEKFRPLIPDLMAAAHDGVETLHNSEVNEYTFEFYGKLVEHFGEEMQAYIQPIIKQLMDSAISDDGVQRTKHSEDQISGIDNDEESGDEEDDDNVSLSVRTSFLDEKCAAIHTIGVIAQSVPKLFIPYTEAVIVNIEALASYFHEDVRFETMIAIQSLIQAVNEVFPPATKWVKGDFGAPVSEQLKTLLQFSFQVFAQVLSYDTSKSVVSRTFGCIADIIALIGPGAIAPYLEAVGGAVLQVVMGNLYCQTATSGDTHDDSDEEDEEDDRQEDDLNEDDDDDPDYQLLHYASECMIEIATVSGPKFKTFLENSLPHLFKLTKASTHHSIRACVIGTVAEIIKVMETDCSNIMDKLFQVGISGLKDDSSQVKRVSCFLLGILAIRCVSAKKEHAIAVLEGVFPILNSDEYEPVVIDNAIGCVCRLVQAQSHSLPVADILKNLFTKLPIKSDLEEIEAVFNTINLLYSTQYNIISPYTPMILQMFQFDLQHKKLDEAVATKIKTLCTTLTQNK